MQPISYKYRPENLEEFVGQEHIVGEDGIIRMFLQNKKIPSMLFWGPPGTGKTTLALIIAKELNYEFFQISAVMDGKAELKRILKITEQNIKEGKNNILFIDEIHRWSKAQQDALLPYVEKGQIVLIGATTENPSFTVINALLSRCHVLIFYPLNIDEITKRLKQIVKKSEFGNFMFSEKILKLIADIANGDLRTALNILELITTYFYDQKQKNIKVTVEHIESIVQKKLRYDKKGEEHYNLISAVHKSIRSSNALAASYWIARMLEAGEDPLYIARRLLRFASEDVGNAKPAALLLAETTYEACRKIGMPECRIFLIQLAMYLADAPKNNEAYLMENFVLDLVKRYGNLDVPNHFKNAPTKFMKDLGYGKGYKYDHNNGGKPANRQCLPDKLHKIFKDKKKVWLKNKKLPNYFRED